MICVLYFRVLLSSTLEHLLLSASIKHSRALLLISNLQSLLSITVIKNRSTVVSYNIMRK